jgi:dimethylargininase
MVRAFTRSVSPRLADCALTHLDREPIDADRAAAQHAAYEDALAAAGATVIRLVDLPDHPDGVFVEDTAILLGGDAIITRPGAPSRAAEADSTAAGLSGQFAIHRMATGRLDGGDVLRVGRSLFVGLSSRSDSAGAAELQRLAAPLGYMVVPLALEACLHLKTAASFAGVNDAGTPTLLLNPEWIAPEPFPDVDHVTVHPAEPFAANVLSVGGQLIMPSGNPRTAERLQARGFTVVTVDVSELQKAEAGVTCMSLVAET